MAKATSVDIQRQNGTDRTVFATWVWDSAKKYAHTDHYEVRWYYATGNGIWFAADSSTVTVKQSIYTAPANASKVKFKIKPVAKTHKVNKKDVSYWTATWSKEPSYNFRNENPPVTPATPTVTINGYMLTAELDTTDPATTQIDFQVVRDDATRCVTGTGFVIKQHVSFTCNITGGSKYKVRCRGNGKNGEGPWSEYSNSVNTIPNEPASITSCKALSSTEVMLTWMIVGNATGYKIEYTTNSIYFDTNPGDVKSVQIDTNITQTEITGLTTGEEWFFRVCATNDQGSSGWSKFASIKIGKVPDPPTTWSESTVLVIGEDAILYWVHNSEDGSEETSAEIQVTINGTSSTIPITDDLNANITTHQYKLATSGYTSGAVITWKVRTKGILDQFSDWSTTRTINAYAPPTVDISVHELMDLSDIITTITSFPFYIKAVTGPQIQKPVSYSFTIVAMESYDTVNNLGEEVIINEGDIIYKRIQNGVGQSITLKILPSDLTLENNKSYMLNCTVSMDSGLTASNSYNFNVEWVDSVFEPDLEIGYDEDTLTTTIRPYCNDADGVTIPNIILAVYRREFDGSFTEIGSGLDNSQGTFVIDPHPALDYARYRVIAQSSVTGELNYYDPPAYPIQEKAVVLQWAEKWSEFDINAEEAFEQPPWTGSLLKLPYNIDISDSGAPDVSLVKYIGRKDPVAYYGTQQGHTSNWNVEILKDDVDTLYALRRLKAYMGNVYVREPSGSGYWAQVGISFSQKHCELTIPVSLTVTKVDGGA